MGLRYSGDEARRRGELRINLEHTGVFTLRLHNKSGLT